MILEHRFVLADFVHVDDAGHRHVYEAGRSYPMRPAVAHAAAKRDLVAHYKPPRWMQPSITTPAEVLTEAEVTVAEAELQALEQHAVEPVRPAPTE